MPFHQRDVPAFDKLRGSSELDAGVLDDARELVTHNGVVIALRSNIRWCSDHLELKCRSGKIVLVLFIIDACDCQIIAWSTVVHAGVSG